MKGKTVNEMHAEVEGTPVRGVIESAHRFRGDRLVTYSRQQLVIFLQRKWLDIVSPSPDSRVVVLFKSDICELMVVPESYSRHKSCKVLRNKDGSGRIQISLSPEAFELLFPNIETQVVIPEGIGSVTTDGVTYVAIKCQDKEDWKTITGSWERVTLVAETTKKSPEESPPTDHGKEDAELAPIEEVSTIQVEPSTNEAEGS